MAEKIKILELDIDVEAISRSTSELKTRLDSAKASLDAMKRAGDTSSDAFVRQQAAVNNLNTEYKTSQRELTKLTSIQNTENLSIKEARNLLSVVSSQWAKQADLYGENSKEAQALAKKKKELTDQLKQEEKATGDTSRNVGNYAEGMQQAISRTSLFGREVTTITSFLGFFSAMWQTLKTDIAAATAQIFLAGKGTEGLSRSQKIAAVTTNILSGALKLFKIALASTGIGLIVLALGSLVAYFSSTQKGIDAVNKALVPLKVVFETLFGVLQEVGEALSGLFSGDGIKAFGTAIKDFVLSRIELMQKGFFAIGKIITGDFKEGMNDLKEVVVQVKDETVGMVQSLANVGKELSDRMQEAFERGQRIADLQVLIEEAERDILVTRAEQELELKKQENIAKDISLSAKERQAAIDEQLRLAKSIIAAENNILDLQIEQLQLKQASNDTSREEEKQLQELLAQRIKNEEKFVDVEKRNLGAQNQLRKEIQTRAAKAQNEAIKASKAELNLFIAQNKVKAQTLAQEVEIAEQVRDKKLKILDDEVKAGKKTKEEAALDEFNIKQEYLNKQTELVLDTADRELQAVIEANQSKLDEDLYFSEQLLQQEQQRLDTILEKQKEFEAKRLEQGVISQTQYNDAIAAIDKDYQDQKEELEEQRKEAEEAKRLIDLENQRILDEENFLNDFERRSEQLELQRQQEVANAEQTGAEVGLINKKFAKLQKQIDREAAIAKIDAQKQMVDQLGGLAQSFFGESKALSSALALADTVLSAQKAYMSQFLPIPDASSPARGAVQAAIATATGLARVAKINGIKFEQGGLMEIGGQRHSAGGTKFVGEDGTTFEAERGELIGVMNRRAAAHFMKFNNSFLTGGSGRRNYFDAGGIVQRGISENLKSGVTIVQGGQDPMLAEKLAAAVSEIRPQVAVEDINTGQDGLADVIEGANL